MATTDGREGIAFLISSIVVTLPLGVLVLAPATAFTVPEPVAALADAGVVVGMTAFADAFMVVTEAASFNAAFADAGVVAGAAAFDAVVVGGAVVFADGAAVVEVTSATPLAPS